MAPPSRRSRRRGLCYRLRRIGKQKYWEKSAGGGERGKGEIGEGIRMGRGEGRETGFAEPPWREVEEREGEDPTLVIRTD